jgi:hypothetical protein
MTDSNSPRWPLTLHDRINRARPSTLNKWANREMADLLKRGRHFAPVELPPGLIIPSAMLLANSCFSNAALVANRNPRMRYCEGYAKIGGITGYTMAGSHRPAAMLLRWRLWPAANISASSSRPRTGLGFRCSRTCQRR